MCGYLAREGPRLAAKKTLARRERSQRTPGHRPRRVGASRPEKAEAVESSEPVEPAEPKPEDTPEVLAPAPGPFVVGIGASAGGLEALTAFFAATSADSGLAFVVVTHQQPQTPSLLPELLARHTRMPVAAASDHVQLQADHVYVCPPGKDLALLRGALQLMPSQTAPRTHLPIDYFFRSLAEDQKDRAICIVLSGTGTDGSLGLRAIKGHSGMAIVQDEASAHYAGMPHSAAATLLADYVLEPAKMPAQLLKYTRAALGMGSAATSDSELRQALPKIFVLLRDHMGHDFSDYKPNTMERRIQRRLRVHGLTQPAAYVALLQKQPQELELLFHELLINVTQFFRDPDAFAALGKHLGAVLDGQPTQASLRIWVPGCATGEEPYSIAMLALELAEQAGKQLRLQVFRTDLDPQVITIARQGVYSAGIAADVSPERLQRFFVAGDNSYRIHKRVRDCVVFAAQNLLRDPPFTRLDVLSCRNLLIYLSAPLQQRLFPLFHYALKPSGLLWLGSSETLTGSANLFASLDRKWKLYTRCAEAAVHPPVLAPLRRPVPADVTAASQLPVVRRRGAMLGLPKLAPQVEELLLARFAPPTLIVNERGDIAYIHGRTGRFLEPTSGEPKHNVLAMARDWLRMSLVSALRLAAAGEREIVQRGIPIKTRDGVEQVTLFVRRLADPEPLRGLYRLSFALTRVPSNEKRGKRGKRAKPAARELQASNRSELELKRTRESLQGTLDELQTSNEELTASNEELQSTNEELQSTNEELETSKEELQSLNEELHTLNAELQMKMDELAQVNDDMYNLLNSTDIATLFLDRDLKVKRFTEQARRVVRLISSDVGRPIADIVPNVRYATLVEDAERVLQTLCPHETEVQTLDGVWLLARILPHQTSMNVIDGVVITFVDIHRLKRAEQLAASRTIANSIVQTVRDPLLVLDSALHVVSVNRASSELLGLPPSEIHGRSLFELDRDAFAGQGLREVLEQVVREGSAVEGFELNYRSEQAGARRMQLSARPLEETGGTAELILVVLGQLPAVTH